MDILSDNGGTDVHPYLDRVWPLIKATWYKVIPESASMKRGKVTINFRLMKDGQITDVHVVDSSGDIALDRAAYIGITGSNPLPSMPTDFGRKYLQLQFHF